MLRRLRFELRYLLGNAPWDTQVSPPELLEYLRQHQTGRAIDLGCGTGTNVLTMAEHGWEAAGVDISGAAVAKARRKARRRGVDVTFVVGDVTRGTQLTGVDGSYDLALDLGCFHTLERSDQEGYVHALAQLLRPGGDCLLYCFLEPEIVADRSWPSEARVEELFSRWFSLTRIEHGEYHEKASAWFTWRRHA